MKAQKCKPSAQFAYNYTINVSSKCGNIISHRSSVFEGRQNAINLRRSAHRSSIFESRHINFRRSTHRSSKIEGGNIAPTTQQRADIPTIRHQILSTSTALHNWGEPRRAPHLSYCCVCVNPPIAIYIKTEKTFKNEQRSKDAAAKKRPNTSGVGNINNYYEDIYIPPYNNTD